MGGGVSGFVFHPSDGMADEMTFGAQDTRAGILAVLVDQFGEAGARHGEWLRATMSLCNVSKATFNRHLDSLTSGLTVEKRGEKYYPVRPSETNDETIDETKANLDKNSEPHQNIKIVRPDETNDETKFGLKVSPVPPPNRGDGETDPAGYEREALLADLLEVTEDD